MSCFNSILVEGSEVEILVSLRSFEHEMAGQAHRPLLLEHLEFSRCFSLCPKLINHVKNLIKMIIS